MNGLISLLVVASLVISAIIGYLVGAAGASHASRAPGATATPGRHPSAGQAYLVGSVGNESISSVELEEALKQDIPEATERLLRSKAIAMEAQKLKVTLPEKDFPVVSEADDPSGYRRSLIEQRRSQRLLRALILRDAKEEDLKHFYETFQDQLTRYQISVILVANEQEANFAELEWKVDGNFDEILKSHGIASPPGTSGKLGFLSSTEILSKFGVKAWKVVANMKPDTLSPPVPTPSGLALIRLGKVVSSYEELKPVVEDIFAASGQRALLRRLREDYQITVNYKMLPFLDPRGGPAPTASPSATETPSASPADSPSASNTP
jgi:hypothetical protein